MTRLLLAIMMFLLLAPSARAKVEKETDAAAIPFGVIDQRLLKTAYVDGEQMRYDVFWTGGVKIGELTLEIFRMKGIKPATFRVKAVITTENGAIHGIYPVRDVHLTTVSGPDRLPSRYEVEQKEGYNYQASRLTRYNQQTGRIWYKKNADPSITYWVEAPIHNEFSAFLGSRVMPFAVGEAFLVPTFADKRRNEVQVRVLDRQTLDDTILGRVDTMQVTPILEFKGLYDKNGDTVIWYTDDACRVPVRINSKLKIGSLTLDLTGYRNASCPRYDGAVRVEEKKTVKAGEIPALPAGSRKDE
ncbi:MAG: DUF3108 domain-containing protein [Desulfobulbaceae bacterium]|nr:MAG: DUF3108 domain-containing protein [Desulfobulbaceae bacterium]